MPLSWTEHLTQNNKIATPAGVKSTLGYDADTYAVGDQVFMHFSEVYTTNKMEDLFKKLHSAASETTGGVWGGELVLQLPKPKFQQLFPTSTP